MYVIIRFYVYFLDLIKTILLAAKGIKNENFINF